MADKPHKYLKIIKYIKNGIDYKSFTDTIPSENQLAEKFGVSRMTARRALVELALEGTVERIPGKGTFIRKHRHYTSGFFTVRPFRKWAEELNAELRTDVLKAELCDPPHDVALKLDYDGELILLEMLNYLDGIPVRHSKRYLRADYCAGILWEDLASKSVHEILMGKYKLPLTKISQTMTAVGLPGTLAELFQEKPGYPVFFFQRIAYSETIPINYVEYTMRGDMAFEDTFSPHLYPQDIAPLDN